MGQAEFNYKANRLSRRRLLQIGGTAISGIYGMAVLSACSVVSPKPGTTTERSAMTETAQASDFSPDIDILLRATKTRASILPGDETDVWAYRGELVKGEPSALQPVGEAYLGPTIRVRRGQKIRVRLENELDEPTNLHWHGLSVPPEMDGHPRDLAQPGGSYTYEFEVRNRAGTYWYHPHPHGRTGVQAHNGLAGLFIVTDDEESALPLPTGEQDVALVLQDRTFDGRNQFVYAAAGSNDERMGFLGDVSLVNGSPEYALPVATRAYRLRLLNGSNARVYKLAWSDGAPMSVIGTDGGLLDKPVTVPYVTLAPAQRIELWVDFSGRGVGTEVKLVSLAYSGVEAGMVMGGMLMDQTMPNATNLPNGAPFDVMTVRADRAESETLALPASLAALSLDRAQDAGNYGNPRTFALAMDDQGNWTINGRAFEMDAVAEEERVRLGALEVWEFTNVLESNLAQAAPPTGQGGHTMQGSSQAEAMSMDGMKDFMAHPLHIHGVQFQILERQIADDLSAGWETLKDGVVDAGWHDTVFVMPGERVKLLLRFDDYPGVYVYHCHNLEHEDLNMMRNFQIEP